MKIYFLSSRLCALTLNDAYFGVTDQFERFAEVSLKDRIFVRFTPENALPLGFFLTENIRFSPPEGCEVYLLKDGLAVYARDFPPRDFTLRPVAQKRDGELLATVFVQGETQVSLQSPHGFFVAALPPAFAHCEIEFHGGLVFLKAPDNLAVFTQKGENVLLEKILSFSADEKELSATLPLCDPLGRHADCKWSISEDGLTRTEFTLRQTTAKDGETAQEKIRDELLPYAFFTSVLIGANFEDFLSDELALKADKIKEFLGDFVAVTPTQEPNVCGLVRKKGERLFEVAYFQAETKGEKICDLKG